MSLPFASVAPFHLETRDFNWATHFSHDEKGTAVARSRWNFFINLNMIELLRYPVLTEKSMRLLELDQYTFDIDVKLTKSQIKKLVEKTFDVIVTSVNTHIPPKKNRRVGLTRGSKPLFKRVIVKLKQGQSLQLFREG